MKALRLLLPACLLLAACTPRSATTLDLCIGTYGQHFYRVTFCDGTFGTPHAVEGVNASFVLPVDDEVVLAVSENDPHSAICSFRGDATTAINPCIGGSPCYLMQIPGLPYVLTADYMGGSLSVFSVNDGVVGNRVQSFVWQGDGPVEGRQEKAHAHQLKTIPAAICNQCGIRGDWLLATDLGADSIHVLSVNREAPDGKLLADCPQLSVALPAGCGPRHMEFNEQHHLLYCITELSGEVLAWQIGSADGVPTFTLVQRVKADNADAAGSADIHLHPNGQYLYTSHRLKDDGITIFRVGDDGLLTRQGKVLTESHPRHFFITPDGRWLLAACRDGHCVQVFSIDVENGQFTATGERLVTPDDGPVCVAPVPCP